MPHVQMKLPGGKGDALISNNPDTDTAVVFIHGFKGHFQKTWQQFQLLMDDSQMFPEWDTCDAFFFSYDAESNHPDASAQELGDFIQSIYPNPPDSLFEVTTFEDWIGHLAGEKSELTAIHAGWLVWRKTPCVYRRLQIVGHSWGGAVARRYVTTRVAAFDSMVPGSEVAPKSIDAGVFLFAPAHFGFQPSGNRGMLYHTAEQILGRLLHATMSRYRAFKHMSPGSPFLTQLRSQTEQLAGRHADLDCLRPYLFWGKLEDVVEPGRFDCDLADRERYEDNRGHIDICKPDHDYLVPMTVVRRRAVHVGSK
jgi:pimeloyl-ACP methyl ester carboxylesterase